MKIIKEFTHELKERFQYSDNGKFQDAEIITIKAPKGDMLELNLLDGLCTKAERRSLNDVADFLNKLTQVEQSKIQNAEKEKDDDDKAIDAYNSLMSGLELSEIKQFNVAFKEILKRSAEINNDKKFEDSFYGMLSINDKRLIMGNYIRFFTTSSLHK